MSRKNPSLYFAKFTFSEIVYLGNSAVPGCCRPAFTDYKDGERTTIRLLQIIMLHARNYPLMFSLRSKDDTMLIRYTETLSGSGCPGWAGILEKILFKKIEKKALF